MACIYKLKGRVFQNVDALNDFLMSRVRFEKKYGDVVYSVVEPARTFSTLADMAGKGYELFELKNGMRQRKIDENMDDFIVITDPYNAGEEYVLKKTEWAKSFIGVTTGIPRIFGVDGKRLVEEYNLDAYFTKLKDLAARGSYEDFGEENVKAIFGSIDKAVPIPQEEFDEKVRKVLEAKWRYQANVGNAIHDCMQAYFTGIGIYNKKSMPIRLIPDPDIRKSEYLRIIRGGNYGSFVTQQYDSDKGTVKINSQRVEAVSEDMLDDSQASQVYTNAEKVYQRILDTTGSTRKTENFDMFAEFPVYDNQLIVTNKYGEQENKQNRLSGSIDLMIVGKDGIPHIIDFKTSPKSYSAFADVKRRTYTYQLAIYRQMLNRAGINTDNSKLYIAPIRITGLERDDEGKWHITGIDESEHNTVLDEITSEVTAKEEIQANIEHILRSAHAFKTTNENYTSSVINEHKALFPEHSYSYENISDEKVKDMFDRYCAFDNDTGKYKFFYSNSKKGRARMLNGHEVIAGTKEDPSPMYEAIKAYMREKPQRRIERTRDIYNALKEILNEGNYDRTISRNGDDFIDRAIDKYKNGQWEVVDQEDTLEFGVILLQNKNTGRIDAINITNENLNVPHPVMKGSTLLSGHLHPDIVEKAKKSRMMEAVEGNVELVKTLSVLNNLDGFFSRSNYMGDIMVINPYSNEAIHASNSDLTYTYNTLIRGAKRAGKDVHINKDMRLGDAMQIIKDDLINLAVRRDEMARMWEQNKGKKLGKEYDLVRGLRDTAVYEEGNNKAWSSMFERNLVSNKEKRSALIALQKEIEDKFPALRDYTSKPEELTGLRDVYELYIDISKAIGELSGIQFTQQLFESNDFIQFKSVSAIFAKGYTSTQLDNPGMLYSDILNQSTNYVGVAYQNIRDRVQEPLARFAELEQRMQKAIGKSSLAMLIKNRESIWKEFYRTNPDGSLDEDLLFKDPEEVKKSDPIKGQILEELLFEINRVRLMGTDKKMPDDATVESMKGNISYYFVPLAQRGFVDDNGMAHGKSRSIFEKIKNAAVAIFNFKNWKQYAKDGKKAIGEFLSQQEEDPDRAKRNAASLFELHNNILGETSLEDRRRKIQEKGIDYFTQDAITAGLSLAYSKISSQEIEDALTLIKCSMMHLKYEGERMNRSYEKDIKYLQDYVMKNIKNESLTEEHLSSLEGAANRLSDIATLATLGMSPVQAVYQPLQGLFSNASLVVSKQLGKKSFGWKEFSEGMKIAYSDMFKGGRSKAAIINQLFGLNDMDMNEYIRKANDHKDIVTTSGLRKIFMMASSRPDYYNRMTIFAAQMLKDGTWDAYEYNEKTHRVKYNFLKDKRFSLLNNPNAPRNEAYYEQLGEYNAIAKRMAIEGVLDEDGNPFTYTPFTGQGKPKPLPKAYTTQQSEAYKNIANDVYGYYTHEQKAMIHATLLGKLFMQFKTFLSGKKNQYLLPGGVRMRGEYAQAIDDDGNKIYNFIDEDGLESACVLKDGKYVTYDGREIDQSKVVPLYVWKGRYQEGIIVTFSHIMSDMLYNDKSFKEAIGFYLDNVDPTVRDAFLSNMKLFASHMIIALLVGCIFAGLLRDLYKEMADDDEVSPMTKTAMSIFAKSVTNAALDADIINTFSNVLGEWTPMTISWSIRTMRNIGEGLFGDKTLFDMASNSVSLLRQIEDMTKPLLQGE